MGWGDTGARPPGRLLWREPDYGRFSNIKDQIHSPVPWVLITLEPTHWCQTPVLPMLSICTKRFVRSAIGVSSIVAAFNHLVKNNSLGICFPLDIIKYVNLSPKRDVVWSQTRWRSIGTVQRLPRKSRSWKSVLVVIQFYLNVGFWKTSNKSHKKGWSVLLKIIPLKSQDKDKRWKIRAYDSLSNSCICEGRQISKVFK